jgi:trk system potassium uptake protein TrkA
MNIVIVGCGRVAATIATRLHREHHVTVIDWNPGAFSRLPEDFEGSTLVGNGIDVDTLRSAGVERADVFLALTDGDNRNLMATQVAKHLGARQTVARVYDAERSEIFSERDFITFSPTIEGARRLFDLAVGDLEG